MPRKTKVTKAPPSAPVKKPPKKKFTSKASSAAALALPTERKKITTDISDYSMLFYAREKFGKTTLLSTFPDILFLSTEPGTKGLEIFEFNAEGGGITSWDVMRRAVELLEKGGHGFKNVAIDTTEEAYNMCMAWVCKKAGVEHPHDANDYGKTWRQLSTEFADIFHRIQRAGLGLTLTSHDKATEIATSSGSTFTRIGPSLPGSAASAVLALVDFIFYGEFVRDSHGDTRRVLITRGDELVTAGQRKMGDVSLPTYIALPDDETKDYDLLAAAFRGEDVGLDPAKVRVANMTSDAGKAFMEREIINAKKGGGRAKR